MNFKKRLLINIGIPLGICLILVMTLFFVGSDITGKTEQIGRLRAELLFRLQSTESLAALSKEAEQAQNYTVQLEGILPKRDQLVSFPRDLSMIARQAQVDINSTLGEEISENGTGLRQTSFSITGQGSLDNFINFLKSFETARYLIKLRMLDFTRQDGSFKALLTGQVFSF